MSALGPGLPGTRLKPVKRGLDRQRPRFKRIAANDWWHSRLTMLDQDDSSRIVMALEGRMETRDVIVTGQDGPVFFGAYLATPVGATTTS